MRGHSDRECLRPIEESAGKRAAQPYITFQSQMDKHCTLYDIHNQTGLAVGVKIDHITNGTIGNRWTVHRDVVLSGHKARVRYSAMISIMHSSPYLGCPVPHRVRMIDLQPEPSNHLGGCPYGALE